MATDPAVDDLLAVIDLVAADATVPGDVRSEVARLRSIVDDAPRLAYERILEIGVPALRSFPLSPPMTTLYRALSLPAFRGHIARTEFRLAWSELTFRAEVERLATVGQADQFLTDAVDTTRIVFDAEHSWLVDGSDIELRSGTELPIVLELRGKDPPFVVCRLTVPLMVAAGVLVRKPTGLDAAVGLQPQWHPEGIPAGEEYVDSDISGSAIDRVLWRP